MKKICMLLLLVVLMMTDICFAQAEVSSYDKGREAFNAGNYTEAALWFEKYVEEQESQHALFYLYRIYSDPAFPDADEDKANEWLQRAAKAKHPETMEILGMPPLWKFQSAHYDELSMDEIPEGELTEELLDDLEEKQENQLFDELLPWLIEKGYIQDWPRSAFLNYEGTLWIEDVGSFYDLSVQYDTYELVENPDTLDTSKLPTYYAHLSPECTLKAYKNCNYFAMYFWSVDMLFKPCPKCFPEGWAYDYIFSFAFEGMNKMRVNSWTEAVPGKYDQPRSIVAYYDYGTDECLSVAVLYYKQGYIIVYQKEGFEINGILDRCTNCDREDEHRASWSDLGDGLWHCRWCGTITKIPEDR